MREYKILPARMREVFSIQFVMGLTSELKNARSVLSTRLNETGDAENVERIQGELEEIIKRVLNTVDADKLLVLKRNLANQQMRLVTKNDPVQEDFTLIPADGLADLLAEIQAEKCAMCLGGADEMRQCRTRNVLKRVAMEDLPENGICGYRDVEWGG